MKKLVPIFLIFLVASSNVYADDFQDGVHAVEKGDFKTAYKLWLPLAEQGEAAAQYNLGLILYYYIGDGEPNYKEAIKWYHFAAEQGHISAQHNLGVMYDKGQGVPQDYALAHKWWKLSAEQGDARAQLSLAMMYDRGQGVPQDDKEAVKWYHLSAEQGEAQAQYNLGVMYHLGNGVAQNYKEAVKWYRLSAEQGHLSAQHNLGLMFADGKGVPQDYALAYMWWNIAGSNGHKDSIENRGVAEERMSSSQIEKAQELTRQWLAKRQKGKKEPERTVTATPLVPNPAPPQSGTGSGFFVSKMGHVITNAHVVKGCKKVTVGDSANKQVPAEVINTDRSNDLALLKLSSLEMASAESKSLIQKLNIVVVPLASKGLLRSEDVKLGEEVLVAGFPFGDFFSNSIKVTKGIVSAERGAGDDSGQFQLDAAVQPGNSGGPIYDSGGNIVGVVISQLDKMKVAKAIGSMPENVNFGIKASTVRQFLTASGLPSKKVEWAEEKSTQQLAEIAKNQALMVMCLQEVVELNRTKVANLPSPSPPKAELKGKCPAKMSFIPKGELLLSTSGKRYHITRLISAFCMDKFEVTQAEYERVMETNPSDFKGANRPVDSVVWSEAKAYCEKVGKRLPTEWEWEKAAKAGTTTEYYWGNEPDATYAWYGGNYKGGHHPVGQKEPNNFGLYDMSGNVWEWTNSDHEKYEGEKVLRGGSWSENPLYLRSAIRYNLDPSGHRLSSCGFRCAK